MLYEIKYQYDFGYIISKGDSKIDLVTKKNSKNFKHEQK